MLEINARSFMGAVMEMRRVQALIEHVANDEQRSRIPDDAQRIQIQSHVSQLIDSLRELYAQVALIAADRLHACLDEPVCVTWAEIGAQMRDIESRLRDELGLVRLFVLPPQTARYLLNGEDLLGPTIADRFPSVIFEMEEAAKCLAVQRSTASAFHAMRALEVPIRAIAAFLDIPDPTKPAERNWGVVLKTINDALDAKYPARARMPGSVGSKLEGLYASLDAIKNPWRNATMHAENVYQPHEADHILQCVNMFMLKVADVMDEQGNPI